MDMTERVNDLIFICERMIDILTIENQALIDQEPQRMKERLDEKTQLSLFYERHMKSIQRRPDCLKGMDEGLMENLRELSSEMQELLEENGRLLKVAMESNRRVMLRVADAAKEHVPHSGTYAPNGTTGVQDETSVAVTFNQEL